MGFHAALYWKKHLIVLVFMMPISGQLVMAQNLGQVPQTNVAVQGQTGAQPEGAFLNFINWIGNVIAPVAAGGAVVAPSFPGSPVAVWAGGCLRQHRCWPSPASPG